MPLNRPNPVVRKDIIDIIKKARFAVVEAPSGYGKSFAIRQLIERDEDNTYLNFSPLPWDNEFKPFALRFIEELRRIVGAEYLDLTYALLETGESPPDIIAARFARELVDVRDNIRLVVEDFHLLDEETQRFALDMFLYLPDNIGMIIVSRQKVSHTIPRRVANQISVIDQTALSFSGDEIARLFVNALATKEIATIREATEGWPLGINLLYKSWEKGKILKEITEKEHLEFVNLFEGIYAGLKPELREFLIKTSLLPYFDYGLIRSIFLENGKAILDELITKNLFIEETKRGDFRYHRLFRLFLEEKAKDEYTDEDIEWFRADAGLALIAGERYIEGFKFLEFSGDWGIYNQAVRDNLPWFEAAVTSKYRMSLGESLPISECEKYPALAYLKGVYGLFHGGSEEAARLFKIHLENEGLNAELRSRFIAYSYNCALQLGDEQWKEQLAETAETLLGDPSIKYETQSVYERINRAFLLFTIGKHEYYRADYEKRKASFVEAISLIGNVDNVIYYSIARDQLDSHEDFSDEKGKRLGQIIARLPDEAADMKSVFLQLLHLHNLGQNPPQNTDTALKLLSTINPDASLYYKIVQYMAMYNDAKSKGDINGCLPILEAGLDILIYSPRQAKLHDWRGEYALTLAASGQFERAYGYLKRNYNSLNPDEFQRSQNNLIFASLIIAGLNEDVNAVRDGVEIIISDHGLRKFLSENRPHHYRLLMLLYSYLNGETEDTREYYDLLFSDPPPGFSIIPFVLEAAFKRFPDLGGLARAAPASGEDEVSQNIRIDTLGNLGITATGGKLTARDFRYSKSAELLAFLALTPGRTAGVEQVIYELWGEIEPKKGRERLRTALYNLNKDLKTINITGLITRSRDDIALNPGVLVEIDVQHFEQTTAGAEVLYSRNEPEKAFEEFKKVVDMYKGDFLANIYSDWCTRWFHYYRLKYEQALEKTLEISADLGLVSDFNNYARVIIADEDNYPGLYERVYEIADSTGIKIKNSPRIAS